MITAGGGDPPAGLGQGRARLPDPGPDPGGDRQPAVPGRELGPGRLRAGAPGPARARAGPGGRRAGRARSTSTPRSPSWPRAAPARSSVRTARGSVRSDTGRAGHERVSGAAAPGPAAHRADLRLRADDRAAVGRRSRRRSAGGTGRACPTWPTSSTTSGSPPTTASCSAATTPSTTTAGRVKESYEDRPASYRRLASHFFAMFPQLEGLAVHATAGPAPSTPAHSSARSTGWPGAGGSAYTAGFTGLGVGAARFAADVVLDLLAGADTERTRLKHGAEQADPVPAGAGRVGWGSSSPAGRWTAPTTRRVGATRSCAPWTGWASASTPDRCLLPGACYRGACYRGPAVGARCAGAAPR